MPDAVPQEAVEARAVEAAGADHAQGHDRTELWPFRLGPDVLDNRLGVTVRSHCKTTDRFPNMRSPRIPVAPTAVAVALANKLARIAWAVWTTGTAFETQPPPATTLTLVPA